MTDPLTFGIAAVAVAAVSKPDKTETVDGEGIDAVAPVFTEDEFCKALSRAVDTELGIGGESNRVIVALAAYESGFGKTTAARHFNYFNMTAGSQWKGKGFPYLIEENADWEYRPDGTKFRIAQEWRMYDSVEHGVRGFWDFMGTAWNNGRYLQARRYIEQARIDLAATEMYARKYFTYPVTQYIHEWNAALIKVNRHV